MVALSIPEILSLGSAYRAFEQGDIDAGIHLVLPVLDVDTDEWENKVFQEMIDQDFYEIDYPPGWYKSIPRQYPPEELRTLYTNAVVAWIKRHEPYVACGTQVAKDGPLQPGV